MQHPPPFQRLTALALLLLAALACNLPILTTPEAPQGPPAETATLLQPAAPTPDGDPTATQPAPTAAPLIEYQPVFEAGLCNFPIPNGYDPQCGTLIVPENRARAGSLTIRLPVMVLPSRSASPAPDPVIYLSGGPGSSALDVAGYMLRQGADAILDQRDLIIFDQRGTGYAQPQLDCPEREALTPSLLDGSIPPDQAEEAIVSAFRACRDRLIAEGIDITAYTSAANAADVDDLRRALGYEQVNLYGVSYGTRLALTVMRDHPQGVRSALLDSAYPLQVNLYTSLAPNAERAFNVLFDRCAADADCASRYPDLRGVFYSLVDQLNASPVTVDLTAGGAPRTVQFDGDLLVDVLLVGLYNRAVADSMPQMISDIRAGEYGILRERLSLYYDDSAALGLQMAVQCNEEIPFAAPETPFLLAEATTPQIAAFFPRNVQPLFAACAEWNPNPLDPRENQPVTSDIPTLVLAGEMDPITPPEWGRMVANDLTHARFFELPGSGHWTTRQSRCAVELMLNFWADPNSEPSCS